MPLFLHALAGLVPTASRGGTAGQWTPRLAPLWLPVSVAPGRAARGGQSADGARRRGGACGHGKNTARRAKRPRDPERGLAGPGTHPAPAPAGPAGGRARTAGRDAGAGAPPGGDPDARAAGAAASPGPSTTPDTETTAAARTGGGAPACTRREGRHPLPESRASKSAFCGVTRPPRLRDRRPPSRVATRPICRRAAMRKADWSRACLPRVASGGRCRCSLR